MEPIKKDYKMKDGRTIEVIVEKELIHCMCGQFKTTFKHSEVNYMLDMHSKVLSPTQLKDLRKFINESQEPEQLNLF